MRSKRQGNKQSVVFETMKIFVLINCYQVMSFVVLLAENWGVSCSVWVSKGGGAVLRGWELPVPVTQSSTLSVI